jgi:TolA-binding protein
MSELAPLDAAHAAFDSGDMDRALALLNRHDLEFPRGQLAPEALALRARIYEQRRDSRRVLELTARFLGRYPDHPQAPRMRAMAQAAAGGAGDRSNP